MADESVTHNLERMDELDFAGAPLVRAVASGCRDRLRCRPDPGGQGRQPVRQAAPPPWRRVTAGWAGRRGVVPDRGLVHAEDRLLVVSRTWTWSLPGCSADDVPAAYPVWLTMNPW
jgi:hypothetical protein